MVRAFAGRVHVGKPPFGLPSSGAYKDAAIAVLRATAGAKGARIDTSPLAWNKLAASVATGNLAQDLRLYRALANAFPYEFKNVYADELVQVTEDAIEPIWRRHGATGLTRLLADVAIRLHPLDG